MRRVRTGQETLLHVHDILMFAAAAVLALLLDAAPFYVTLAAIFKPHCCCPVLCNALSARDSAAQWLSMQVTHC